MIHSYIRNRYFVFRHAYTYSTKQLIRAEVPQGSILFSLLYSAYTNDIPRLTSDVQHALFASNIALHSCKALKNQLTSISRGPMMSWVDGSVPGG
ncbi:Probable RNA-directed DNA polymerase from transposon BS [Eumeta japonica]|uniref:Probable RNA-directed DNA polymerase from transposon BS n=1 Tax=Eumeta variegata TaxID=151549 RepID=A0A4C1Y5Y5_EUMVA|nr:Probable RNA-directed DNA polymerase from transposon BS [Eumeta japonica]